MTRPARQILFVQGAGEDVHNAWDDKLVDSLRRALGPSYEVVYPAMPDEADPQFAAWRGAILKEMSALRDGAVVVGHSVGGTVLINVLAEKNPPITLGGIFLLAAPFIGDGGWKIDDIQPPPDLAARLPREVPVVLYHGADDDSVPVAHLRLYADALRGAKVHQLANRDHQFNDDLSEVAADIRALDGSSEGLARRP